MKIIIKAFFHLGVLIVLCSNLEATKRQVFSSKKAKGYSSEKTMIEYQGLRKVKKELKATVRSLERRVFLNKYLGVPLPKKNPDNDMMHKRTYKRYNSVEDVRKKIDKHKNDLQSIKSAKKWLRTKLSWGVERGKNPISQPEVEMGLKKGWINKKLIDPTDQERRWITSISIPK